MSQNAPNQERIDAFVRDAHFNLESVEAGLAEEPALLELRSSENELPIEAASHVGNRPIIEHLMEAGAEVPLCTRAVLGEREAVLAAVDRDPAAVESRGAHGMSLLFHAVVGGDETLCRELLARGARPSTVGEGASQDPLHAAVFRKEAGIARMLVDAGADPDAPNYQGKTPRELAAEREIDELLAVFGG